VGKNRWTWYSFLEFLPESVSRCAAELCPLVHAVQEFHTSRKFGGCQGQLWGM
jgi:hypothetical protein